MFLNDKQKKKHAIILIMVLLSESIKRKEDQGICRFYQYDA